MSSSRKKFHYSFLHSFVIFVFIALFFPQLLLAQQDITVRGTVINSVTKKPIDFVTVVFLEERKKAYTNNKGLFQLTLTKAGEHTVIIRAEGMATFQQKMNINAGDNLTFRIEPLRVSGQALEIRDERDVQKISRHTMTVKQLKEVPASFGDAINALTSLPGVNRTSGGIFGPLVIRGSSSIGNNYYLDGIPMFDPMHFGGLHSVINNNLMDKIDLYSSAFPVEFGNAYSSVIDIQTKDKVDEFAVIMDISILSASVLLESPLYKLRRDPLQDAAGNGEERDGDNDKKGYVIASGRYSYFTLLLPAIIELFGGDKPEFVPSYWDYQLKLKYFFSKSHSLTLLFFGSGDKFDFIETDELDLEDGEDPLLKGFEFQFEQMTHSQGLYYGYQPSSRFNSRFSLYNVFNKSHRYINLPAEGVADWAKDIYVDTTPNILGVKNDSRINFLNDLFQFNFGLEYVYYYFVSEGKTLRALEVETGIPDFSNEDLYQVVYIDEKLTNQTLGTYLDSKLKYSGLEVVAGVRSDYLERADTSTFDPRGRISYEFPSQTTLSLAGGHYSYFFQVNRFIFSFYPDIAKTGKELEPEKAIHRVVGIEQEFGLYTIKLEGYYNSFYDLATEYFHYDAEGNAQQGLNAAEIRARGVEIMIRKDLRENRDGFFGWISYTYTQSKYRSNLPTEDGYLGNSMNQAADPLGDQWIDYDYEQPHFLKLVIGYVYGRHTFSSKVQYYSSQPYTPIIGSTEDTDYRDLTGMERYVPIYGDSNSMRFDDFLRIDIRYSNKKHYSWGYFQWYIEVINVLNYQIANDVKWDSRYPYSSTNPEVKKPGGLVLFPSFGIEIKF